MAQLQKLSVLDTIVAKLDDLGSKVSILTDTVNVLQSDIKANSGDIKELRRDFETFKSSTCDELRAVKTTLNNRELQLRSSAIRLFNYPVLRDEAGDNYKALQQRVYDRILRPLMTAAKGAGDLASVPQIQNTIESCYRVFQQEEHQDGKAPPPILIRLTSRQLKVSILKQRRQHMPQPTAAEKEKGAQRFVVVEDLTPPSYKLLKALQADERTEKVWTVNGQIHFSLPKKTGFKKVRSVFDTVDDILNV